MFSRFQNALASEGSPTLAFDLDPTEDFHVPSPDSYLHPAAKKFTNPAMGLLHWIVLRILYIAYYLAPLQPTS